MEWLEFWERVSKAADARQAEFFEAVRLDAADGFPVPVDLSANGLVIGTSPWIGGPTMRLFGDNLPPTQPLTDRPWPPPAPEIPVTPEMVAAARDLPGPLSCWPADMFVTAYRAMRALDPRAIVPTYYDIGWDERRPVTQEIVDNMDTAIQKLAAERTLLRQALAAKDARIAELKSVLACTPVAFEDPDAKPVVKPNPFRDFGHDPRRMGPL